MPLEPHLYFWEKETDPAALGSGFYPSLGSVACLVSACQQGPISVGRWQDLREENEVRNHSVACSGQSLSFGFLI